MVVERPGVLQQGLRHVAVVAATLPDLDRRLDNMPRTLEIMEIILSVCWCLYLCMYGCIAHQMELF